MNQRIIEWFTKIRPYLPEIPLKSFRRNEALRVEILNRFVGLLLTDDERAELFNLPKGCRIREGAKIICPENLVIGEFCWIGENAIIDASGGLEIGSHTSIGPSVFVWSHSSHLANLNMSNIIGSNLIKRDRTVIGSGCFIAGPSVVLPGTVIGDKCIIRPFSIVEGLVPERSIVSQGSIKPGVLSEEFIKKMTILAAQVESSKITPVDNVMVE
jgi:acetyltransferase-like isoleucine patch superfamily enzyme